MESVVLLKLNIHATKLPQPVVTVVLVIASVALETLARLLPNFSNFPGILSSISSTLDN